jgi:predicted nucleotidyltransferase
MKNKDTYGLLVFNALKFFIKNPYEEIYLRDFSRRLNISPNTAQRFLNLFLKENFIKEEKKANLRFFKANLDNILFRYIKKTSSVKELIEGGLINLLKNVSSFVVLYGSVAKGLDDKNSDIDLLIISSKKKEVDEILLVLEKRFNRTINSHTFSFVEWEKQKKDNKAFYQEIISTGINLIGEIPI